MSFVVLTDTSGNLRSREIRNNDLKVIPFPFYIDGIEYSCTNIDRFSGDSFYKRIRDGLQVTTSQINPARYMAFFEPWLKKGKDIILVTMSSGISGACNAAHMAADTLLERYCERRVEIVDSLGASLGEGILALQAARLRDLGKSVTEAADELRKKAKRMFNVFTVDDLMHLKRGGRLSNLSAVVGTVLNIKPLLKGNEEGKIVAFSKIRGRRKAIESLAQAYETLAIRPEEQIVGIAQAGCLEDAEYLAQLLRRNHPPKEILTVEYEPVTGSHVGPSALALFFEGEENVRSAVSF